MGRQHYGGDLTGKWILTAGLGGMGGAQPLAAVMAGAHCIAIEVQESSIEKRLETRYLDHRATSIDEALEIIARRHRADQRRPARQCRRDPARNGRARHPSRRGHRPDLAPTTPPTAIARPAGASPNGPRCARRDPAAVAAAARNSMAAHVEAMLAFQDMGIPTFDYGNNIRQEAFDDGRHQRLRLPRLRPRLCPARCSAAASARSAGSRCRAIPRTSTAPTPR